MLTTTQAAEILGVNDSRIRQLILEGRLRAEKFGSVWAIKSDDLAQYMKGLPKPKFPR